MKPPNIWRIFSSFFRHVSISKNAGQPAEQQARLIAMPSRGCSSAQAKERFLFPTDRDGSHCFHTINLFIYLINALTIGHWGRYIGSFLAQRTCPCAFLFHRNLNTFLPNLRHNHRAALSREGCCAVDGGGGAEGLAIYAIEADCLVVVKTGDVYETIG